MFRLFSLHELADLAADHTHRLQQPLLRLADLATIESEHADRLSSRHDRKENRPVQADVVCDALLHGAGVLIDIGDPQRLTRPPYAARQSYARAVGNRARRREKALDRLALNAPGLAETQDARGFVHEKVSAAVPALRFADRAEGRFEPCLKVFGIGEVARHHMLELQQLLRAPALGDVARNGDNDVSGRGAHRAGMCLDQQLRSVLATVNALHHRRGQIAGEHPVVELGELLARLGEDVLRAHRQQLFPGVAERPAGRVVHIDVAHAGAVDEQHQIRRGVHRDAEPALFFFRALAL